MCKIFAVHCTLNVVVAPGGPGYNFKGCFFPCLQWVDDWQVYIDQAVWIESFTLCFDSAVATGTGDIYTLSCFSGGGRKNYISLSLTYELCSFI